MVGREARIVPLNELNENGTVVPHVVFDSTVFRSLLDVGDKLVVNRRKLEKMMKKGGIATLTITEKPRSLDPSFDLWEAELTSQKPMSNVRYTNEPVKDYPSDYPSQATWVNTTLAIDTHSIQDSVNRKLALSEFRTESAIWADELDMHIAGGIARAGIAHVVHGVSQREKNDCIGQTFVASIGGVVFPYLDLVDSPVSTSVIAANVLTHGIANCKDRRKYQAMQMEEDKGFRRSLVNGPQIDRAIGLWLHQGNLLNPLFRPIY